MTDTMDRIEKTLDTLRPYIASHRGQVEVVDFDESDGVLLLRMGGTLVQIGAWCQAAMPRLFRCLRRLRILAAGADAPLYQYE